MLSVAGTARCVSDLHLRAERPDLTERFAAFLADTAASNVEALFILGDLFEYWIGDDDLDDPFNEGVCSLLRGAVDMGPRIYLITGNRDFLLGALFAEATRVVMLDDATKVSLGGTATLLLHGDALCIDDLPYQAFRSMVRDPAWREAFLARPIADRRAEVASLRLRSKQAVSEKSAEIMDVSEPAVRQALMDNGCRRMIHGHTHRPGEHALALDGSDAERWVLSDWDSKRGDALQIDSEGIRRLSLID